ncbi:MAG: DUF3570 domain-containing protein [Verrucomicrobia bacterium]|nr:DUF3570 domain-containing protein [Verrucomicrobiota bacterium]
MPVLRLRGENHFDYKFENYQEENGRIHVQTQGALFGYQVHPSVSLEGEFVYDSISGATPNGVLPPPGTDQVVLQQMEDTRWAGNLQAGLHWGRNTTTPQFAYSLESDYESIGLALNHTIDFNEKNTTVAFGVAYTHDTIMPIFWGGDRKYKNGADFLIGLTQLLGSKTILTANLTYGTAHGFLSDPYKVVHVPYYPDPLNPDPFAYRNEQRPNYRNKYIGFLALTQFVTPLNGSAELGYRLYHDSYGILSHTASLTWYQKIGKNIIVSPTFRFTDQSAADFYILQLPGDPAGDPPFFAPLPKHFSADYRLSALQTFTYGIGVTWKIKDRVSLDLAYKRYEMVGKDNKTSASAYPSANVFSAGLRVWL